LIAFDELDFGFGSEGLSNEFSFPQRMRLEITLDGGSWAILR
jgi:hypothetical protein